MNRLILLVTVSAALGLAACSSTSPAPKQNAAPVTQAPSGTVAPSDTVAPSTSVVTEVVTRTVTNPPVQQAMTNIDTRLGYGALKLGMTLDEARAAGLTDLTWEDSYDPTCVSDDKVAISKKYGVERITLPADATTSKGIGVGSAFADVKRAYPNASEYRAGWSAKVADNALYAFLGDSKLEHFADTDKVVRIKLQAINVDCAMASL